MHTYCSIKTISNLFKFDLLSPMSMLGIFYSKTIACLQLATAIYTGLQLYITCNKGGLKSK